MCSLRALETGILQSRGQQGYALSEGSRPDSSFANSSFREWGVVILAILGDPWCCDLNASVPPRLLCQNLVYNVMVLGGGNFGE